MAPVVVQLNQPTRDGETSYPVLTNLPPEDWSDLATMSLPQFSSLLQEWGRLVNLKAFTSARPKTEEEKAQTPL